MQIQAGNEINLTKVWQSAKKGIVNSFTLNFNAKTLCRLMSFGWRKEGKSALRQHKINSMEKYTGKKTNIHCQQWVRKTKRMEAYWCCLEWNGIHTIMIHIIDFFRKFVQCENTFGMRIKLLPFRVQFTFRNSPTERESELEHKKLHSLRSACVHGASESSYCHEFESRAHTRNDTYTQYDIVHAKPTAKTILANG